MQRTKHGKVSQVLVSPKSIRSMMVDEGEKYIRITQDTWYEWNEADNILGCERKRYGWRDKMNDSYYHPYATRDTMNPHDGFSLHPYTRTTTRHGSTQQPQPLHTPTHTTTNNNASSGLLHDPGMTLDLSSFSQTQPSTSTSAAAATTTTTTTTTSPSSTHPHTLSHHWQDSLAVTAPSPAAVGAGPTRWQNGGLGSIPSSSASFRQREEDLQWQRMISPTTGTTPTPSVSDLFSLRQPPPPSNPSTTTNTTTTTRPSSHALSPHIPPRRHHPGDFIPGVTSASAAAAAAAVTTAPPPDIPLDSAGLPLDFLPTESLVLTQTSLSMDEGVATNHGIEHMSKPHPYPHPDIASPPTTSTSHPSSTHPATAFAHRTRVPILTDGQNKLIPSTTHNPSLEAYTGLLGYMVRHIEFYKKDLAPGTDGPREDGDGEASPRMTSSTSSSSAASVSASGSSATVVNSTSATSPMNPSSPIAPPGREDIPHPDIDARRTRSRVALNSHQPVMVTYDILSSRLRNVMNEMQTLRNTMMMAGAPQGCVPAEEQNQQTQQQQQRRGHEPLSTAQNSTAAGGGVPAVGGMHVQVGGDSMSTYGDVTCGRKNTAGGYESLRTGGVAGYEDATVVANDGTVLG